MRFWVICSGEAKLDMPARCTLAEYNALCERALDGGVEGAPRRVAANGRRVCCSPRLSARETAEMAVAGAEIEIEERLDELPRPKDESGRARPSRLWRFFLWLRRLLGMDRREGRKRADALIDELEKRGEDCILISHPGMIASLIDALRVRGYCVQRTGMGRIKPFEQMLLSRRGEHCGGCGHNCLLSNPGCSIGRDKAARQKERRSSFGI